MAERLITSGLVEGVADSLAYDDATDTVIHRRAQDVEPIIDAVARANSEGIKDMDGLRLVAEVPITLAQSYCDERGIPWEAFLYGSDHDAEFMRFVADHQKLQYTHSRRVWGNA